MPLSTSQVSHFLRRVGFGGSAQEIDHFAGREIPDVVDEVLSLAAVEPPTPDFVVADSSNQWWAQTYSIDWWIGRMVDSSWVDRTPETPGPLQERLALFWHGHFATEQTKVQSMVAMMEQNQLFRTSGLGEFEPLCQAVAVGGAMLRYLDNDTNQAGAAQENFARELMELFTMGIGHYTEDDVTEMARAWTGHGVYGWVEETSTLDLTYVFSPDLHDNTPKTIFGVTRNWDGPETITDICQVSRRDETARFIATKMWKFFAGPNPSPALIDELAAAFKGNGDAGTNLSTRELLRAIFEHPEFWATTRQLVKGPVEYMVDVYRRLNYPPGASTVDNRWMMGFMGQTLFDPPNVAGWGTNGYWLSTATAWGRGRFAAALRWSLDETLFAGLEAGTAGEASARIFEAFGIEDPTSTSTEQIEAWFAAANTPQLSWSISKNAPLVGSLLPETQLA